MFTHKERRLTVFAKRRPVAANHAVMGDDRQKIAAIVVGFVAIIGREDDVAALVTDKVFVVGRNQEISAFAETTGAAIGGEIKFPAFL